ncbi:MAG TPA: 2-phospho-L-lactate guanylyltransferase [Rubrobacteraceae bacterium]|nr:2-phospho-L-lactate guanylyltransferase [Rubrobacteraceae bacterium]
MSVFAVVPVKDLWGTKSRLSPILNPGARAGLTLYMMGRVIRALHEADVSEVGVVSPDPVVLHTAADHGATPVTQESRGLNPALEEGRRWAIDKGASAILVLPADLPLLDAEDVRAVISHQHEAPSAVISPDAAREGTNALLLKPPDALPFLFGEGSYEAHVRAAVERGVPAQICERPHLSFDLDTADDFQRLKKEGRS